MTPYRRLACFAMLAAPLLAPAQPGPGMQRPNEPVFREGAWTVVRSVREGGSVVACTGFYRANRAIQLSGDMLIIKTPTAVQGVAFAFDDCAMPALRPLTAPEQQLGAVVVGGEDFKRLAASRRLNIEVQGPNGRVQHALELRGIAGALANIKAGCPRPAVPLAMPPERRAMPQR